MRGIPAFLDPESAAPTRARTLHPRALNCNEAFASLHCRGERDQAYTSSDRAIMCVYCKEAPACDHERDACEASRGERCITCGHDSAAFLSYTPGPRRVSFWIPVRRSPKRKPFETSTQARRANVKGRAPKSLRSLTGWSAPRPAPSSRRPSSSWPSTRRRRRPFD
jgi:hypothetical protein